MTESISLSRLLDHGGEPEADAETGDAMHWSTGISTLACRVGRCASCHHHSITTPKGRNQSGGLDPSPPPAGG